MFTEKRQSRFWKVQHYPIPQLILPQKIIFEKHISTCLNLMKDKIL